MADEVATLKQGTGECPARLFKREYNTVDADAIDTNVDVENPYSGMQTAIFDMLEDAGRLCQWSSEDDLVECAEALVSGQE